jgi:hypothetical protein
MMSIGEREPDDKGTWIEDQKIVYSWLRNLVVMNNDFVMGDIQYEQEFVIRDTAERPRRVSYSNYEKFAGQLFYYGTMNSSEFIEYRQRQLQEYKESSDAVPVPLPQVIELPPLDLRIDVELKCPIELAPIEYLQKYQLNNFDSLCNHIVEPVDPVVLKGRQSPFFFKIEACGPGRSACVMPSSVELEIKSSDFAK